jgi:hypothetical protein
VPLNLDRAQRAHTVHRNIISDLKNDLSKTDLTASESNDIKEELKKYKMCLADVCFTVRNLNMMNGNYPVADDFAKEYTKLTKEIHGTNSKHYTYALMLEA